MRELKFRALFEHMPTGKKIWFYAVVGCAISGLGYVQKTEWLQYTELKDKNNNEIYEGDIIKSPKFDNTQIVKYAKLEQSDDMSPAGIGFQFNDWPDKMVVIGNIYENTELLD